MSGEIQKRLAEIVGRLSPTQASALLEFAEFLLMRQESSPPRPGTERGFGDIAEPVNISRPSGETVIRAIKRLRATYPMLDARQLLGQTSDLMSQHMVEGREATEVIEELEILFRAHYEKLAEGKK